jgi:hypothetical protein
MDMRLVSEKESERERSMVVSKIFSLILFRPFPGRYLLDLGYLGARPYQEVFQLIEGLQNEAKSQVQPAVEEPKVAE